VGPVMRRPLAWTVGNYATAEKGAAAPASEPASSRWSAATMPLGSKLRIHFYFKNVEEKSFEKEFLD